MANPTTNYGFVLPTSSDLVTDLPADFDVALQGVDTRLKALQPGTTLGDLAYSSATANTNTRLGIGSTGNVLTVAGGVPTWAAPAGGTNPAFKAYKSANQTLSPATFTKVTFDVESFDTAGNFASSRFTPTTAGYYELNTYLEFGGSGTVSSSLVSIYKNGTRIGDLIGTPAKLGGGSDLFFANGSSDYFEVYCVLTMSGGSESVQGVDDYRSRFSGTWSRS